MTDRKIEPWRVIVGIAAISFIAIMAVQKDLFAAFTALPKEQALPMLATAIAVTLAKTAAFTGAVMLIKWIYMKIRNAGKKDD